MQDDIGCFKIINTYRQTFLLAALTYKSLLKFLLFLCLIMSKTGLLRVQFSPFSYSSSLFLFIRIREHRKRCRDYNSLTSSHLGERYADEENKTKLNENSQLNHVLVDLK